MTFKAVANSKHIKIIFKMHFSDLVGACNRPNNWCSLRCLPQLSSTKGRSSTWQNLVILPDHEY